MHSRTWILVLAVALIAPLTVSAQSPSDPAPRNTQHAAAAHHPQSAIGRALAGLLQQVPAPHAAASRDVAATTVAPRDAIATVPDGAPKDAPVEQVEVAVH